MKVQISKKHLEIDKAQRNILLIVALATVITVFSLISSKALLSHAAYQRQVLNETNKTNAVLEENLKNSSLLVKHYEDVFIGKSPTNIIGGRNSDDPNTQPPDGNNARIVLDALPTSYDFPALVTSVSFILSNNNMSNPSISGTDQSVEVDSSPLDNPQPVPITITASGTGDYESVKKLVIDFERSIRPFDITNLTITGGENNLQVTVNMNTYFQPAKTLTIGSKEVR